MVVSTIYDKDLKQKVFQVRDSERYTNSTLTSLEVTTNASNRNYLQLSLTATVQKHLGASSVVFYDGDEMIGTMVCNQGTSTVTCQAKVSYGYHKLRAKYVGNAECLSSRSGIVEVEVTEPNLIHTAIDLSDIKEYYFKRQDINEPLLATMINEDTREVILDETLKFYLNNVFVGYVYSDDIRYNTAHMNVGEYTCKIVFDGDDEYFGCETEFTFKVQENDYIMDIDYPTTRLAMNEPITIKATLSNVDLTPKVGTTLYLKHGTTVVDTKTTNSDGEVTFNIAFDDSTLYITDNEYIYESLYFQSPVMISHIQIQSDEFTSIGQMMPITVSFDNVSNLLVHVDNEDLVTDSNGQVVYEYQGSGVGNKTITASAGEYSASKTVKDLLMYYSKVNEKEYNFNFSVQNALSVLRKINGLELASGNIAGSILLYSNPMPIAWDLEFRIVSMSRQSSSISSDFKVNDVGVSDAILRNNPVISVRKRDTVMSVYYGDTLLYSGSNSQIYPKITAGMYQTVVIDDVKLLWVSL